MHAKYAKAMTDQSISDFISKELPKLVIGIDDLITKAARVGEDMITVTYDDLTEIMHSEFHKAFEDAVAEHFESIGYDIQTEEGEITIMWDGVK